VLLIRWSHEECGALTVRRPLTPASI
jgi:hypothetical protein